MRTTITYLMLLNILIVEGWRPYSITFQNACDVLHPKIVDFQISDHTTDNMQYFTGYANILQDISSAFVDLTVLVDSGNEKFDLTLLNKTINICHFLTNRKSNIFIDILFRAASKYVELQRRCPIVKKLYKFDNATFDVEKLPPALPDKKMLFHATIWFSDRGNKIILTNCSHVVSIERKYKRDMI